MVFSHNLDNRYTPCYLAPYNGSVENQWGL